MEPVTKRNGTVEYVNSIKEKSLQVGRYRSGAYTESLVRDTWRHNVREVIKVVPKLVEHDVRSFRLSSSLLPLHDLTGGMVRDDESLANLLGQLGAAFLAAGVRVTTHPGQFTVLSSDSKETVRASLVELDHHGWVFDKMGLPATPYAAINIHGGKRDRLDQLVDGILSLPDSARKRLSLENDESGYSLSDLLPAYEATGTPVCWDSHHHTFNPGGLTLDDAYGLSVHTWQRTGCRPLQHLSNTEPGASVSFTDQRKHSFYITEVPDCQRQGVLSGGIDLDVEAKAKNLAVLALRKNMF